MSDGPPSVRTIRVTLQASQRSPDQIQAPRFPQRRRRINMPTPTTNQCLFLERGNRVNLERNFEGASIASTPEPPYVAVIFTSLRSAGENGYGETAEAMLDLARQQDGFLGVESARDGLGITVSYWCDENAASAWKYIAEHLIAQRKGRDTWYADYRVRVATVVREYGLANSSLD
jgi:heme-degrading monooxygenase HmoA